jgi:hypothetical protein
VAGGRFTPGHLGELAQVVPFELVDEVLPAGGVLPGSSPRPCGKPQARPVPLRHPAGPAPGTRSARCAPRAGTAVTAQLDRDPHGGAPPSLSWLWPALTAADPGPAGGCRPWRRTRRPWGMYGRPPRGGRGRPNGFHRRHDRPHHGTPTRHITFRPNPRPRPARPRPQPPPQQVNTPARPLTPRTKKFLRTVRLVVCCPTLKMPTKAAFTIPMNSDGDAPPLGAQVGRSSARCRFFGEVPVVQNLYSVPMIRPSSAGCRR